MRHQLDVSQPNLKIRRWAFIAIWFVGSVAGGAYFFHSKVQAEAKRKKEAELRTAELALGPKIRAAVVRMSKPTRQLLFIGEARPQVAVTIYSKASGYIKEIKVDRGDRVKKGDIIAVIESAEVQRQYDGARAEAATKTALAQRMKQLKQKNLISAQEAEQAINDATIAQARLGSVATQLSYGILRAPFDGVITAKFADVGALVQNATNSQTSALPLVTVSNLDRLRVTSSVDQRTAHMVNVGQEVSISNPDRPETKIKATVTRSSGELDPRTRMKTIEIDVDNSGNTLLSGSFVQITMQVPVPSFPQIPSAALITKKGKFFVPVISKDSKLSFKEVRVAETDGKVVRIKDGIDVGEVVGLSVGSTIADGSKVRPTIEEVEKAKGVELRAPAEEKKDKKDKKDNKDKKDKKDDKGKGK